MCSIAGLTGDGKLGIFSQVKPETSAKYHPPAAGSAAGPLPLARAQCVGHPSGHASSARSSVPRSLIERRCARPAAMAAASATTRPVSATQGEHALAPALPPAALS